jgi:hypothetical protein
MKQCPNPNCILYTRLEELPDAYVRCPACGGQMVDAATSSGALSSGHLPRVSVLSSRDLDEEFEQAFGDETSPPVAQAVVTNTGPHAEGEYDPYYASTEYEVQYGPGPISRLGRLGYITGALLLVAACGLFVFVMATRVLPQSNAVTGVQATQTTLAAIRPAINTPISELPTANALPTSAPPTSQPPPAQPTDTPLPGIEIPPTIEIPPAPTTQPPPAPTAQPNSTAPPAQTQPTGGILAAFMTTNVQSGQTIDTITVYDPSATFVLAVQAQFGADGVSSLVTRWYGPDNGLLYELPRAFAQSGTYYSAFTLSKTTPWLEGSYRVDIYTNGASSPAYTIPFSVSP